MKMAARWTIHSKTKQRGEKKGKFRVVMWKKTEYMEKELEEMMNKENKKKETPEEVKANTQKRQTNLFLGMLNRFSMNA